MPDAAELIPFAEQLADAARVETLSRFRDGAAAEDKGGQSQFDPVTAADRESERVIRAMIAIAHPRHGVVGEEFGVERPDAEWRWVLDPIDGTRAFICGAATWTTLIALERRGSPVIGLIDQPFTDERWVGAEGRSVWRRAGARRDCRTSGVTRIDEARISTTDPRDAAYFTPAESRAFLDLAAQCRVARFSLDAYAYGLLAIGQIDLVVEAALKHYDFAALIPVVEGAGGVITDWTGAAPGGCARGRILASATPALHEAALARLFGVS